ncbi:hypothetical protein RB195_021249 [Necator americanus]|uniref:ZP domain-containing protein n=1 Tax=Necator americanus TaxID=51031 RepID=A0ABR1EB77_NECAM
MCLRLSSMHDPSRIPSILSAVCFFFDSNCVLSELHKISLIFLISVMSIAILNDPQLSTDVYDLLISQTAPSLVSAAPPQPHDFVTLECYAMHEHQQDSMKCSLALFLRL